MVEDAINNLAHKIVKYFSAKGLSSGEIQAELEEVFEIILSGEEVNLVYLNMRLKECNEKFAELSKEVFAEILAFLKLRAGVQFEFGVLH